MEGVQEVYGLHNWPSLEENGLEEIVCADKEQMAACAVVFFSVKGRGGHGSEPQNCVNPVPVAARAYLKMQQIVDDSMKANPLLRASIP